MKMNSNDDNVTSFAIIYMALDLLYQNMLIITLNIDEFWKGKSKAENLYFVCPFSKFSKALSIEIVNEFNQQTSSFLLFSHIFQSSIALRFKKRFKTTKIVTRGQ